MQTRRFLEKKKKSSILLVLFGALRMLYNITPANICGSIPLHTMFRTQSASFWMFFFLKSPLCHRAVFPTSCPKAAALHVLHISLLQCILIKWMDPNQLVIEVYKSLSTINWCESGVSEQGNIRNLQGWTWSAIPDVKAYVMTCSEASLRHLKKMYVYASPSSFFAS